MSWFMVFVSGILGILIALTIGLYGTTHVVNPKEVLHTGIATTTVATTTPPIVVVKKPLSASVVKAPHPIQKVSTSTPAINPSQSTSTNATTEPPPVPENPADEAVSSNVRAAVVNIICTTQASGSFSSISGSGVFIDPRGVILTNSHVAQYFLLKDYPSPGFVSCVIRSGSPAQALYTADLLYLPPPWMAINAYKINQSDPTGDGQHDYAFLLVTGTVNPSMQLPTSFPALPISIEPPTAEEDVLLAAYPAQFLGGITIAENLYETSAESTVGDLYTFATSTLDLFSVGGTVVAQKGSSGGAVTDGNGNLLGLIVTASEGTDTASSDLRALSTPYIISDFQEASGVPLQTFLNRNLLDEEEQFSLNTEPELRTELENALQGQ